MRVTIKTERGQMEVDLAVFFPTSLARVRKLFRLMDSGLDEPEKEKVREYLKGREDKERIESDRRAEKLLIGRNEMRLKEMTLEKIRIEREVRSAKARIRVLDQEEKAASAWIREFDYICGSRCRNRIGL